MFFFLVLEALERLGPNHPLLRPLQQKQRLKLQQEKQQLILNIKKKERLSNIATREAAADFKHQKEGGLNSIATFPCV